MAQAASDSVHEYPSLSLVGNLIDDLLVPKASTFESGTAAHSQFRIGPDGAQRAVRWQARLLLTNQEVRERLVRANDCLERLPAHRRVASVRRIRAILVSENPPAEQSRSITRAPKRAQRFVAFLVTEIQRALGTSLDEAIEMTSTVSRLIPEFGFIGESTLRSWYNKSGPDYRGLKQLACWSVAYWKRLAYFVIKMMLEGVRPGYRVAEAAAKNGVITKDELASVRSMAIKVLRALREIGDAVADAPVPSVRSGWEKVNIQQVSKDVLPMLGL